jgi:hypothetical protein
MQEGRNQTTPGNSEPTADRISRAISIPIAPAFSSKPPYRRPYDGKPVKRYPRLNGLGLCVPATRNTEAVKNYPRGVGAIECVEVNAGYVVIQKIVTLFQGEVNADAPDHFRIVLASL